MKDDIGIYIHIPFCKSKCYYCDFASFVNREDIIEKYVNSLCNEILQKAELLSNLNIKTIYIGGGTPSFIDEKYIKQILDTLYLFVCDKSKIEEITIEVNPGTCTKEKILNYKKYGINRISLGVQSTHNDILKNIGRIHKFEDVLNTLEYIKSANIDNVSVDLMYPLPGLTLKKFENTLDTIINLKDLYNIKHISIYNLEVHENSKLDFLLKEGFLSLPDEDEEYNMKQMLEKKLNKAKFYKYEISNFAIKGYEAKHNLNYWKQKYYLGFGVAASSYMYSTRYDNTKNIEEYINKINNFEDAVISSVQMDKLDTMKEYVILNLRVVEGINIKDFKSKFKTDIFDIFKVEFEKLIKQGLINVSNTNIFLTPRGMEVANIVWQEFI